MDVALYRTDYSWEFIPSVSKHDIGGCTCLMVSWLNWTLDIQW